MALALNALVSLNEVKDWLSITLSGDDAKLEEEINRASDLIEAYCQRPLKRTTALNPVTIRRSSLNTYCYRVGVSPIDTAQAVVVTVDGTAQTVWRVDADGDPDVKDVVVGYSDGVVFHPGKPEGDALLPNVLYRAAGWVASKVGGIVITYCGGLALIPADLKEACCYVVQKLWRDRQRGLAEVTTVSGPSGNLTILDNALPRVARLALDRYRLMVVG